MFSKDIVSLNIESNDVRFLVTRGSRITQWGSIPLTPGIVKNSTIANRVRVSSAIKSLFLENDLPKSNVITSLTGLRSVLRTVNLPKIKPKLLAEAIQHESEREMPISLDELYLSQQLILTAEHEQQFIVLGVPRDVLDAEFQAITQAGIELNAMYLKPLALARAVNQEEALIVDLESETFDLIVVIDGVPAIMRTVVLMHEEMTLGDKIQQLTDEISRTVQFYNNNHHDRPISPTTPMFLTGALANDAATYEHIRMAVHNPIDVLLLPFTYPPDFPVTQYAVNIGLALSHKAPKFAPAPGSAHKPIANPNVLPPKYMPQPMSPTKLLYPATTALLILLFMCFFYLKSTGDTEIAMIQNDLNSANQQLSEMSHSVRTLVTTINDVEAKAQSLEKENETILDALKTSNLSESLYSILEVRPQGIWLSSINQTKDEITVGGYADHRSDVADYVVALEQTGYFSNAYAESLFGAENSGGISFNIICTIAKK